MGPKWPMNAPSPKRTFFSQVQWFGPKFLIFATIFQKNLSGNKIYRSQKFRNLLRKNYLMIINDQIGDQRTVDDGVDGKCLRNECYDCRGSTNTIWSVDDSIRLSLIVYSILSKLPTPLIVGDSWLFKKNGRKVPDMSCLQFTAVTLKDSCDLIRLETCLAPPSPSYCDPWTLLAPICYTPSTLLLQIICIRPPCVRTRQYSFLK